MDRVQSFPPIKLEKLPLVDFNERSRGFQIILGRKEKGGGLGGEGREIEDLPTPPLWMLLAASLSNSILSHLLSQRTCSSAH